MFLKYFLNHFFLFRYENGGFESSFTPAQLQQIRKVTLAQVLCQTMENVDTLQPFVFLSSAEFGNERVPCDSFLFNNFDLSPWTEREFDFDNSINDFERTTNLHLPSTGQPNFTKQMTIDDLLADIFNTNKKTTPKKRPTVTISPLQLDDKLDLPKQTKPSSKATSTSRPPETLTSKHIFPKQTVTPTLPSTIIKINDKLDFISKTLLNGNTAAQKRTDETNNTQSRRSLPDTDPDAIISHDIDKLPLSVDKKNDSLNNGETLASKTYGPSLSEEFPFFSNLFNTIRPLRPIVKPQITLYQQEYATTVKPPDKYTYLINIVPKTTTPRYDSQKETIKITIQGQQPYNRDPDIISYPFNKRPVYNQNKLEYRPVANSRPTYDRDEQYSTYAPDYLRPQHSSFRPQTTSQDRYDLDQNPDHHQRPRPSPYQPTYQSTTDYNPYGLVTFSHIETTKRPDLFNRPRPQYSTTDDEPTIVSADDGYGNNPRPIRPQSKPVPTGITIYIDNNKPRPKPQQTNNNFNNNGGYSSISSDDENIPLFTRPSYQKPFSQKPVPDFRPQYPKPTHFDNTGHDIVDDENSYNKPLQSDYGQFSSWSNRPDVSYSIKPDSDGNNDNTYSASHKQKPSPSNRNPSRRPDKPRPKPSVDISLASEYGTHHHTDISIVLKPNQNNYKSSNRPTPTSGYGSKTTTVKPVKHFYIGNILYNYPQTQDGMKHQLARTTSEGEGIIKENYNNVWKPDKDEHEHFYGAEDVGIKSTVEDVNGEKSSNQTSNSKEHFDSNLPLAERKDDMEILPIKRRLFINAHKQSKGNNKDKNHVFFDVIPSENRYEI